MDLPFLTGEKKMQSSRQWQTELAANKATGIFAVGVSKAVTDLVHLVWVKDVPIIIAEFQILCYPIEPEQLIASICQVIVY